MIKTKAEKANYKENDLPTTITSFYRVSSKDLPAALSLHFCDEINNGRHT
jgi:hypothetical protein